MDINRRDRIIAALTLYGECRGEPREGKVAVMWVIRNRAEADLHGDTKPDWWGESIQDVCLRPNQFSCWGENDPNRKKLLAFLIGTDTADPDKIEAALRFPVLDPKAIGIQDCMEVVDDVCKDRDPDPTHGATHYHARGIIPRWAIGHVPTARIGQHVFYSDIEPGYRPRVPIPSTPVPGAVTRIASSGPPDPPAPPVVHSALPTEALPSPGGASSFWDWVKRLFGA